MLSGANIKGVGYHAQVFKFHFIGWWTWNVVFCTCQTYAVVMNFTNVLNYKLWQRLSFFSLWRAYIHASNSILVLESLECRCVTFLLSFVSVLIFGQMWVFCLSTWICTTYVPGEPSSQNMVPETLNLELWIVVSPHISFGNWTHLHKIGKCCSLLGHLSCPVFFFFFFPFFSWFSFTMLAFSAIHL